MCTKKSFIGLSLICLFVLFVNSSFLYAYGESFGVYSEASEVAFEFYPSGYSDGWYWGYSEDKHEYSSHEVLSGDFGAAIFFSGIRDNKAMWLTQHFEYPSWNPVTDFNAGSYDSWNDPLNFIDNIDTAQSMVEIPNLIRVTIDYSLVDLGEDNYSPLSFITADGSPAYVKSEQWVCLLSYTVKNIKTDHTTIQDLRFFQFLHAHPTGTGNPAEFSSYSDADYEDALMGYDPCNPDKNFKYDISQWRSGNPSTQHVDWIGFSSTVAPNHFDSGDYVGIGGRPETGTHVRIENKSLNDEPNISAYDSAGAMEWDWGNLAWNAEKKITIAIMFGCGDIDHNAPIPPIDVTLTKTDDISTCVYPSTEDSNHFINYTICFTAGEDVNDVNIVDILPEDVYFQSCTGGGNYNAGLHQVVWDLGNLDANDANCFTLTVKVADFAQQGSTITNTAKMYSGNTLLRTTNEPTKICCVDNVVYVDCNATGLNNGSNWDNAYTELRDALDAIDANQHTCASQIWVADGIYEPTEANDPSPYDKTFQMLNGIDVYGHFGGIDSQETQLCQRNLADANNETILTGDINGNGTGDVDYVVRDANMTLDGFTVKKSRYVDRASAAIYCYNTSSTIENCITTENDGFGIKCENANGTLIKNCVIKNSLVQGVYCLSTDANFVSCTFGPNNQTGLHCVLNAKGYIFDCLFAGNNGKGIYASESSELFINNSNILNNSSYGIESNGSGSNVSITNSIVANNTGTGILTGANLKVERCKIYSNGYYGIESHNALNMEITDSLIYRNTTGGIFRASSSASAVIRNNTLYNNGSYGINLYSGTQTAISNNIVWGSTAYNITNGFSNVTYNCIQGGYTGTGNRSDNPEFRNAAANDFHLIADSNCINAGNPSTSGTNETDIDGEARKIGSVVDIGADEFNPYDLSLDGLVNFEDFAIFAKAWGTHTGQTDFNDRCDFYDDGATDYINYRDLEIFCDYWLSPVDWQDIGGEGAYFAEAECPLQGGEMMMMSMPPQSSGIELFSSESLAMESVEAIEYVEPPVVSEVEPFDVNETLDWLDDLWISGELTGSMTEAEFEAFRNSIENYEE